MPIEHNTPEELEKIARYQHVISDATKHIWQHLADRAKDIPTVLTDLTESQLEILLDIEAVEEEWVVDPEMRKEISIVQWEDINEEEKG